MLVRKRSLAAIAATAAVALGALTFAAPADAAAPYVHAPELSVPKTNPACGSSFPLTGTDFVPGSTVNLTLQPGGTSLGSVVVNSSGNFSTTVTLPAGVSGTHQIVATGPPTSTNTNTASVTINIGPCAPTAAPPPPPPPVAVTGVAIFGMVAGAVLLLGIGGTLLYLGRRRRKSAA